jgi:hypothetical protein
MYIVDMLHISLLLPNILTVVKEKLQTYWATTYARSSINQIWILENSKEILANLKAQNFCQINIIKTLIFLPITPPLLMINPNIDFLTSLTTVSLTKLGKEIFISSDQSLETLLS